MSHTNKTDRLTISKVLHIVKVHLSRPSVRLNKVIFSTAQVDFAVLGKKNNGNKHNEKSNIASAY